MAILNLLRHLKIVYNTAFTNTFLQSLNQFQNFRSLFQRQMKYEYEIEHRTSFTLERLVLSLLLSFV